MTIYTTKQLPYHLIIEEDGARYVVPNIPNGWAQRRPWYGRTALTEAQPQQARVWLAHVGAH